MHDSIIGAGINDFTEFVWKEFIKILEDIAGGIQILLMLGTKVEEFTAELDDTS